MNRMAVGIVVLGFGLSVVAAGDKPGDKPGTPEERFQAPRKEFNEAACWLYTATADDDRRNAAASSTSGSATRVRRHSTSPLEKLLNEAEENRRIQT